MTEFKPTWFLAQSDPHRTGSSIPTPDSGTKEIRWFDDMAVVMGIGLLLMLILAVWAKFFRKSSDKRSGKNDKFRSVPDATSLSGKNSETEKRRKKEDAGDEIIAHEILLWLKQVAFLNLEKPISRIHKKRQ